MRCVRLFISGWVQGVFFRAYVREKANKYGVKGWVRNLRDGRVEALLEGDEEGVRKVIEACKIGPEGAVVKDIQVIEEEYSGKFQNFTIQYY
jgi:acylphosphatase